MENKIVKTAMFYFGLLCIITGVWSCLFENVAGGGVIITTGLALILLSQFQIESIKMLGLEAKLRNTIIEAEHVLDKLKKISLPFAEIAIATAANSGRVGGATPSKDMMMYVCTLENQLEELSVSKDEIKRIKMPWITTASFDLAVVIRDKLQDYYTQISDQNSKGLSVDIDGQEISQEKREAILEKIKLLDEEKKKAYAILSLKEVLLFIDNYEQFLKDSKALSEQQKLAFQRENIELIDDINYLIDNGKIRRPNHSDSFPIYE